jgi:hypothetical protein
MFNIIIPVIMVFVYLLYLSKKNIKSPKIEKFENKLENKLEKTLKNPHFTIELVEMNPMFSEEKFIIQDVVNSDGTIQNGVLTKVENTEWKEDFTKKLCMGCSCSNPKVYTKYREKKIKLNQSSGGEPSPSPSLSGEPSPSPTRSTSTSPTQSTSDDKKYDPMLPKKELEEYYDLIEEKRQNCGYTFGGHEYQCAQVCPQCNSCHGSDKSLDSSFCSTFCSGSYDSVTGEWISRPCIGECAKCPNCGKEPGKIDGSGSTSKDQLDISTKYLDKCNLPMEADEKELCEYYRNRVKFVKDSCVFPSKLKNVIVNDRECYSFYNKKYNRYYVNDKIIFRLKTNKKVDLIDVYQVFYRNNKNRKINTKPIIFYTDNTESYFFINTTGLEAFEGDMKLFFVVNLTYLGKKERYDESINIDVVRKKDYIKMYENILPDKIKKRQKGETLPADFDLYSLNYIEESNLNPKQIVNGYSVKNPVKDYQIGEFKRLDFKDNPDTWELRADINRPWISVG